MASLVPVEFPGVAAAAPPTPGADTTAARAPTTRQIRRRPITTSPLLVPREIIFLCKPPVPCSGGRRIFYLLKAFGKGT